MRGRRAFAETGFHVGLGAILGIASSPIGVPILISLFHSSAPSLSHILQPSSIGEFLSSWISYIGLLFQSSTGVFFLTAWCSSISLISLFRTLVDRLSKPDRCVDEGILGDAHLITSMKEIRRKNDFWDGKGVPEKAGLVLSSSSDGYYFDAHACHVAICGKTGSGKSHLICLQSLHLMMSKGWSLIVTGKSELLELTGRKADELGYDVLVFDLNGYPGASRFNPLDLVVEYVESNDVAQAQQTARQTAADLVPMGGEHNTYFPRAARSLLTACLLMVATADIPREQKNMASVASLVSLGTTGKGPDPCAPLKDYIRSDSVGPNHPAYIPASGFLSDSTTTAAKNVLSTLKEALSIFSDETVAKMTAASDASIRSIIRNKTAVFINLLEEGHPYLTLYATFFSQYWRIAQQEAARNGGRLPRETAILGDEWGNVPPVSAFPELVTLGRSMRLHAYCFTQNIGQWNIYSNPGNRNSGKEKILGSMGAKIALSLANPEDFKYFSALTGKRTVRTHNSSIQKSGSGAQASLGSGEAYSEHADDLIHEWEWQHRIPTRDGAIVIKGGENSMPGREGVFQMPMTYASNTPAGEFFGLGDPEECAAKQLEFRRSLELKLSSTPWEKPPCWYPDFDSCKSAKTDSEEIAEDEWSAWEGDVL